MPTLLKTLLAQRELGSHPAFLAAYDRCAAQLDPPLPPGHGPAKAQYYQWLSGRMVGLPRDHHRRVLTRMFPGWTVEKLFESADSAPPPARAPVDAEFAAFLGAEAIVRGLTVVYPTDAAGTVPEPDLRALLAVTSLFRDHPALALGYCADREALDRPRRPYLGLGARWLRHYPRAVRSPLFAVTGTQLVLSDGTRVEVEQGGLVARVRPSPEYPDRFWFLCAGFGAHGGEVACRYLVDRWRSLHERAQDRDFVAVVDAGDAGVRQTALYVGPPRRAGARGCRADPRSRASDSAGRGLAVGGRGIAES
ncbi:hypothetical protein ACWEKT_27950 [Nocardia takedensis]